MHCPGRRRTPGEQLWRIVYPYLIHLGVMRFFGALLFGLFVLFTGSGEGAFLLTNAAAGLAALTLIPLGLWLLKRDNRTRVARGGFGPLALADGVWAVLLGMAYGQLGNQLLGILRVAERFPGYGELQQEVLSGQPFWLLFLTVGILCPAAEEILFRGLVYLRMKEVFLCPLAVLFSSVLFGLYHGNAVQFFYAGFLGVIFALCYERTKNVVSCVLAHMGANCWSVIMSSFGSALLQSGLGGVLEAAVLALMLLCIPGLFYLWPGRRSAL